MTSIDVPTFWLWEFVQYYYNTTESSFIFDNRQGRSNLRKLTTWHPCGKFWRKNTWFITTPYLLICELLSVTNDLIYNSFIFCFFVCLITLFKLRQAGSKIMNFDLEWGRKKTWSILTTLSRCSFLLLCEQLQPTLTNPTAYPDVVHQQRVKCVSVLVNCSRLISFKAVMSHNGRLTQSGLIS